MNLGKEVAPTRPPDSGRVWPKEQCPHPSTTELKGTRLVNCNHAVKAGVIFSILEHLYTSYTSY